MEPVRAVTAMHDTAVPAMGADVPGTIAGRFDDMKGVLGYGAERSKVTKTMSPVAEDFTEILGGARRPMSLSPRLLSPHLARHLAKLIGKAQSCASQ